MLQQTQVTRVVPAFEAFMERFPSPDAFARLGPAEVITVWGDLGYLRRAVNLHRAAEQVAQDGWPDDLTTLPGVGPYTAAAIRAFADDHPVAAVDINLRRVLSRWEGELLGESTARAVGTAAVDSDRPGDWNQAMMDLGATVCRPSPSCGMCPVTAWCIDPSVDVRSSPQSPFEGSRRQARAAILKHLAGGRIAVSELAVTIALGEAQVGEAVAALSAEGLVRVRGASYELA